MKITAIIILLFLVLNFNLNGQTKVITGRVIDEDFETIPRTMIQNSDTILIGETDLDGYFKIEIPIATDTLFFSFVAMEWKTIKLTPDCDTIDVILMCDVIYDFMTARKIDRLRLKRFERLPELHQIACEKGLFTTMRPCYEQSFVSIKQRLKAVK
jgi:hypothetical protein